MNERQFRKRTDEEQRARADARRADKDAQKRQKAGRVVWHSSQGTLNEGRNAAKRKRRATYFGRPWVNPRAGCARPTKPVRAWGPTAESRRKAKNRKPGKVSKHTLRFRGVATP